MSTFTTPAPAPATTTGKRKSPRLAEAAAKRAKTSAVDTDVAVPPRAPQRDLDSPLLSPPASASASASPEDWGAAARHAAATKAACSSAVWERVNTPSAAPAVGTAGAPVATLSTGHEESAARLPRQQDQRRPARAQRKLAYIELWTREEGRKIRAESRARKREVVEKRVDEERGRRGKTARVGSESVEQLEKELREKEMAEEKEVEREAEKVGETDVNTDKEAAQKEKINEYEATETAGKTHVPGLEKHKGTAKEGSAEKTAEGKEVIDISSESEPNDEDEDEEEEEEGSRSSYRPGRLFAKLPEVNTGSAAKISAPAHDRLNLLYDATDAQNPDLGKFIHFWRDSEGYMVIEIFHGQLWEYERTVGRRKQPADVLTELWPIAEAMAFYFMGDDDDMWMNVDDGEGLFELLELFGAFFLDILHRLDNEGLLRHDGPIENLGLVMGAMLSLPDDWEQLTGDGVDWAREIMQLAKAKGIELLTLKDAVVPYQEQNEPMDDDEPGRTYDFKKQMREYKKRYGPVAAWKQACIDLTKPTMRAKIEDTLKKVEEPA
ncbi:hypothetical protein FN846DRAFT_954848 [Sphaerosporella brunnea]|uniref:Uncharacterized protein n=1 Tax=Sphaerosporella brunnea TaxID=1250544 RepID=A0A5J5ETV3_9PEZI|nr:hypothetical protein FN846DRAFT_954848 [Sphaerosporella brunnea]